MVLNWFLDRKRGRIITRRVGGVEEPYLARAILFRCRWFGIFLHCFLASDTGGVHDHPWDNASLVLTTGYWEEFADGTRAWRGPGAFVFRRAEDFHRVRLLPESEGRAVTWTLFFVGRRRRHWGFLPEANGWRRASGSYL